MKELAISLLAVIRDIAPMLIVVSVFWFGVLRKKIPMLKETMIGLVAVILGLFLFSRGLEIGIFPIGESMAYALSKPEFRLKAIIFSFCIGYASAMAEPALLAISYKAEEITAGGIRSFALRNTVALGSATGISIGVVRIFTGDPLWVYILAGYFIVILLTFFAPKDIIGLAYDSGGVTTSTITVPLLTAIGLGLARNTEGRDLLIDGFGLIAFAALSPMISLLGYAVIATHIGYRKR